MNMYLCHLTSKGVLGATEMKWAETKGVCCSFHL